MFPIGYEDNEKKQKAPTQKKLHDWNIVWKLCGKWLAFHKR